jgi:hypothetical protein
VVGVQLLQGRAPDLLVIVLTVVMGASLWMGATAAIENARMRLRLPAISAGRLQQRALGVPASTTVLAAHRLLRDNPGVAVVLTGPSGEPEAVVDEAALLAVPDDRAGTTAVDAAARRLAAGAYVPESAEGQELLQFLARLEGNEYAVINRQGAVTGVLHQRTVVQAITGKTTPGP